MSKIIKFLKWKKWLGLKLSILLVLVLTTIIIWFIDKGLAKGIILVAILLVVVILWTLSEKKEMKKRKEIEKRTIYIKKLDDDDEDYFKKPTAKEFKRQVKF